MTIPVGLGVTSLVENRKLVWTMVFVAGLEIIIEGLQYVFQ